MITLKNVSKTLGKHLVLDNINYTFENGMVYGTLRSQRLRKDDAFESYCQPYCS